jgi:hypothetical protein
VRRGSSAITNISTSAFFPSVAFNTAKSIAGQGLGGFEKSGQRRSPLQEFGQIMNKNSEPVKRIFVRL